MKLIYTRRSFFATLSILVVSHMAQAQASFYSSDNSDSPFTYSSNVLSLYSSYSDKVMDGAQVREEAAFYLTQPDANPTPFLAEAIEIVRHSIEERFGPQSANNLSDRAIVRKIFELN